MTSRGVRARAHVPTQPRSSMLMERFDGTIARRRLRRTIVPSNRAQSFDQSKPRNRASHLLRRAVCDEDGLERACAAVPLAEQSAPDEAALKSRVQQRAWWEEVYRGSGLGTRVTPGRPMPPMWVTLWSCILSARVKIGITSRQEQTELLGFGRARRETILSRRSTRVHSLLQVLKHAAARLGVFHNQKNSDVPMIESGEVKL